MELEELSDRTEEMYSEFTWGGAGDYQLLKDLEEDGESLLKMAYELRGEEYKEEEEILPYIPSLKGIPSVDKPVTDENLQFFMNNAEMLGPNTELYREGDNFYVTLEAPNHSTMGFHVEGDTMGDFYQEVVEYSESFDTEEEFNDIWSESFGEHNGFTPSYFANILEEDEEYYHALAKELRKHS